MKEADLVSARKASLMIKEEMNKIKRNQKYVEPFPEEANVKNDGFLHSISEGPISVSQQHYGS